MEKIFQMKVVQSEGTQILVKLIFEKNSIFQNHIEERERECVTAIFFNEMIFLT